VSGARAQRRLASLVLLARPRAAVLVCVLPVFGFGYALWERGSTVSPLVVGPTILALMGVWLLGHVGAMWLNAELDRDEGAVIFSRAVEVPGGTAALGYVSLSLSVLAAAPLGALVLGCASVCALLAVLYSHPRIAWKGHAQLGPLVNGVGYAALSPIAGWSAADGVFTWRAPLMLASLVVGVLGLYFAAQAFQEVEDRARGYRTLVVTHGPRRTLQIARLCFLAAMLPLFAGSAIGVYPRVVLVALVPCGFVDAWMTRWIREPSAARFAPGMVVRLVVAVLCVVAALYAHHFTQLALGEPGGGLGTAIVPAALDAPFVT